MNRWASNTLPITLLFLTVVNAQSICFAGSSTPQQTQQSKNQTKAAESSLTGCVDEQDGRYVLVDDRTLTPIASLEADGFPTEGFAKHLGHKVTVRGTSNSGTDRPVFKVRSVEAISDACGPQNQ